ncbi:MAG: CoB--CoM heterodisulfide reductase iron-sulfur subunit B family protein [Thermodesulfobacteriota bacterium]
MKTYSLFIGCNIPARVRSYESASRAVLERLGVGLVDSREFTCCGYPLRNVDQGAFLLSAARNLALANRMGYDMLVLCSCCFGSLKAAQYMLGRDEAARRNVEHALRKEGLHYDGGVRIKHFLSALYHDIGAETLKRLINRPFTSLKIAAHYGCHALRPSHVTAFDDPVAPRIFEDLVEITGAQSVEWDTKLDCCGAPLLGINDDLSLDLTRNKMTKAVEAGVDFLCTACPYCQLQFETARHRGIAGNGEGSTTVASLLYPQLLGYGMGIENKRLELDANLLKAAAGKS